LDSREVLLTKILLGIRAQSELVMFRYGYELVNNGVTERRGLIGLLEITEYVYLVLCAVDDCR